MRFNIQNIDFTVDELNEFESSLEIASGKTNFPKEKDVLFQNYSKIIVSGAMLILMATQSPANDMTTIKLKPPTEQTTNDLVQYDNSLNSFSISFDDEIELAKRILPSSNFLTEQSIDIIELATQIFSDSKPLSGLELKYLKEYMDLNIPSKPTLPNRF